MIYLTASCLYLISWTKSYLSLQINVTLSVFVCWKTWLFNNASFKGIMVVLSFSASFLRHLCKYSSSLAEAYYLLVTDVVLLPFVPLFLKFTSCTRVYYS